MYHFDGNNSNQVANNNISNNFENNENTPSNTGTNQQILQHSSYNPTYSNSNNNSSHHENHHHHSTTCLTESSPKDNTLLPQHPHPSYIDATAHQNHNRTQQQSNNSSTAALRQWRRRSTNTTSQMKQHETIPTSSSPSSTTSLNCGTPSSVTSNRTLSPPPQSITSQQHTTTAPQENCFNPSVPINESIPVNSIQVRTPMSDQIKHYDSQTSFAHHSSQSILKAQPASESASSCMNNLNNNMEHSRYQYFGSNHSIDDTPLRNKYSANINSYNNVTPVYSNMNCNKSSIATPTYPFVNNSKTSTPPYPHVNYNNTPTPPSPMNQQQYYSKTSSLYPDCEQNDYRKRLYNRNIPENNHHSNHSGLFTPVVGPICGRDPYSTNYPQQKTEKTSEFYHHSAPTQVNYNYPPGNPWYYHQKKSLPYHPSYYSNDDCTRPSISENKESVQNFHFQQSSSCYDPPANWMQCCNNNNNDASTYYAKQTPQMPSPRMPSSSYHHPPYQPVGPRYSPETIIPKPIMPRAHHVQQPQNPGIISNGNICNNPYLERKRYFLDEYTNRNDVYNNSVTPIKPRPLTPNKFTWTNNTDLQQPNHIQRNYPCSINNASMTDKYPFHGYSSPGGPLQNTNQSYSHLYPPSVTVASVANEWRSQRRPQIIDVQQPHPSRMVFNIHSVPRTELPRHRMPQIISNEIYNPNNSNGIINLPYNDYSNCQYGSNQSLPPPLSISSTEIDFENHIKVNELPATSGRASQKYPKLNLKEFLETWDENEEVEENTINNSSTNLPDVVLSSNKIVHCNKNLAENVKNHTEQFDSSDMMLYVLESTSVPEESVWSDYKHIQQIDKLPDNIKLVPEIIPTSAETKSSTKKTESHHIRPNNETKPSPVQHVNVNLLTNAQNSLESPDSSTSKKDNCQIRCHTVIKSPDTTVDCLITPPNGNNDKQTPIVESDSDVVSSTCNLEVVSIEEISKKIDKKIQKITSESIHSPIVTTTSNVPTQSQKIIDFETKDITETHDSDFENSNHEVHQNSNKVTRKNYCTGECNIKSKDKCEQCEKTDELLKDLISSNNKTATDDIILDLSGEEKRFLNYYDPSNLDNIMEKLSTNIDSSIKSNQKSNDFSKENELTSDLEAVPLDLTGDRPERNNNFNVVEYHSVIQSTNKVIMEQYKNSSNTQNVNIDPSKINDKSNFLNFDSKIKNFPAVEISVHLSETLNESTTENSNETMLNEGSENENSMTNTKLVVTVRKQRNQIKSKNVNIIKLKKHKNKKKKKKKLKKAMSLDKNYKYPEKTGDLNEKSHFEKFEAKHVIEEVINTNIKANKNDIIDDEILQLAAEQSINIDLNDTKETYSDETKVSIVEKSKFLKASNNIPYTSSSKDKNISEFEIQREKITDSIEETDKHVKEEVHITIDKNPKESIKLDSDLITINVDTLPENNTNLNVEQNDSNEHDHHLRTDLFFQDDTSKKLDKSEGLNEKEEKSQIGKDDISEHTMASHEINSDDGEITEKPLTMITEIKTSLDENVMDLNKMKIINFEENQILHSVDEGNSKFSKDNLEKSSYLHEMHSKESEISLEKCELKYETKEFVQNKSGKNQNNYKNFNKNHNRNEKLSVNEDVDIKQLEYLEQESEVVSIENEKKKTDCDENIIQLENHTVQEKMSIEVDKIHKSQNTESLKSFKTRNSTISIDVNYNIDRKSTDNITSFSIEKSIFPPIIHQNNVPYTKLSDNIDKVNYKANESYSEDNCENNNFDIPHPSTVEKSMVTPFIENNKNNNENNISTGTTSIVENTNNTTAIHEYNNDTKLTGIFKETITDVIYQTEFPKELLTYEKTIDLNCNSEIFENKKLIHLHTKIIENKMPKIICINSCIDNAIEVTHEIQGKEQNRITVEQSIIFNSSLNKNNMESSDLFEKENQINDFTSERYIVNKEIEEIGESLENLLEANSLSKIETFENLSIVKETEKWNDSHDSLSKKDFVNMNLNQNDLQFNSEKFSKTQALDVEAVLLKTNSKELEHVQTQSIEEGSSNREKDKDYNNDFNDNNHEEKLVNVNLDNRATKNWQTSLKKQLSDTDFEKIDTEKENQSDKKVLVEKNCYSNEELKHPILKENNINNSHVEQTADTQTEETVKCSSTKNLDHLLSREDEKQSDDEEAVSSINKEIEKTTEFQAISNKLNQEIQSINNLSNKEHLNDGNIGQAEPNVRTNIEIDREAIINFKNLKPSDDSILDNVSKEINDKDQTCLHDNDPKPSYDSILDNVSKEINDKDQTCLHGNDPKPSYDSILDHVSKEINDKDQICLNDNDPKPSYDTKTISKISKNSPSELNDKEGKNNFIDRNYTTSDKIVDDVTKEISDKDQTCLNANNSKPSYDSTTVFKILESNPLQLSDKEMENNCIDTNHITSDQILDYVTKEITDKDHTCLNANNSKPSYDSTTVSKISESNPLQLSDKEMENNCIDTNHITSNQILDYVTKDITDKDHTCLNANNSKPSYDSTTVSKISENSPPHLNDKEVKNNFIGRNHTTSDQILNDEISYEDQTCVNDDDSKPSYDSTTVSKISENSPLEVNDKEIENNSIDTNYTTSNKILDYTSKKINDEIQTCLKDNDHKSSYDAKTICKISENSPPELNDKEVESNFIDRNRRTSDQMIDKVSKEEISDEDQTCLNDDDSKPLYDSKTISKILENNPPKLNDKEIKNNFISINHTTSDKILNYASKEINNQGHTCLNDTEKFPEIPEKEFETSTFLENSTLDIIKSVVENKEIKDNEIEDILSSPTNIKIELSLDNLQKYESNSEISENQKVLEETSEITETFENDQSTVLEVSDKLNEEELEITQTKYIEDQSFSNHLENEQTLLEIPERETIIILEDCASTTTVVSEDVVENTKEKDNQEPEENLTLQVDSNDTLILESEDANFIFDDVILIESDFEMGENLNTGANLSENSKEECNSNTEEDQPLTVMNDETIDSDNVTEFDILPNIYEEISHEEVVDEEIIEIEKEINNFKENEVTNNLTEEDTKKKQIPKEVGIADNCEEIVCNTGNSIKIPETSYNEVETSSENVILIVESSLNKEIDKIDSENLDSAFVFDENDGLPDIILDDGDSSVIVTYGAEDEQFEHIFLSNESQALDCFEVIDPSESIDQDTESKNDNLDKNSIQDENSNGIENEDDLWLCTEEEVISSLNSNEKYEEINEQTSSVDPNAENCEKVTSSSSKLNRKESYSFIKISQNHEEEKAKSTTKNIKFDDNSIKKSDFEGDLFSTITTVPHLSRSTSPTCNNGLENEENNKSDVKTVKEVYKTIPDVPLKELVVSCVKIDVNSLKTDKHFTHHDSDLKIRKKKRLSESECSDADVSQPKKICLTDKYKPTSDNVKNCKFESNNNQTIYCKIDCSNTKIECKKQSNSSTNDSSYENLDHENKITKLTEKKRKKFHPYIKQEINKQNLMDGLNLNDPLIEIKPLKLDYMEKNNNSLIHNNNNSTIKSKIPPIKVKNHTSFSEILSNIDKFVYQQKKLSTFKIPKLKKNETKNDQNTLSTSIDESSTDCQSPKSNNSSDSQNTSPRIKIKLKNISKYNDYQDETTSGRKIKKDKQSNTSKQYEIINNSTIQKNYTQNHKSQLISVGEKTSGKFILKNKQFPKMIIKRTKSIENQIRNDNSVLLNNALKWQPFVKLEKNIRLDKMALKLQKQQRIILKINRIQNNEHNNHSINQSSSPSLKCKIRLDKYILPSIVPNYRYN